MTAHRRAPGAAGRATSGGQRLVGDAALNSRRWDELISMAPDPGVNRGTTPAIADPSPDPATPAATGKPPPRAAKDKVRLRFRKAGPLRWLSHHDLLRT